MSEPGIGPCAETCVYTGADESPAEFADRVERKARKAHRCVECHDTIQPGQTYEYVTGRWEGEFSSFKTCLVCVEIRETFCCEGWVYALLWADIAEQLFPTLTTGCLSKLTSAAAKEKLVSRWRRWRGLDERRTEA